MNIKTLKLFKYGDDDNWRQVSSISWHPDGPHKIAVSYAKLNFDSLRENYSYSSYIWDINNSNIPCNIINPKSPITKLSYNHKNVDQIAFGCYSGVVGIWDIWVQGNQPSLVSDIDISHHEPITDLLWLSSKAGNEFITTSTDGTVKWWDFRNINEVTD